MIIASFRGFLPPRHCQSVALVHLLAECISLAEAPLAGCDVLFCNTPGAARYIFVGSRLEQKGEVATDPTDVADPKARFASTLDAGEQWRTFGGAVQVDSIKIRVESATGFRVLA
jgi:hypothetical protein